MKKVFWLILLGLLVPTVAEAQKTCSPVTAGVSQNCLVTITVQPGTPGVNQVQADSFKIRRGDAGGAKAVIGTVPFANLVLQNSFTDAGNIPHCYDAIAVKAGYPDALASAEQCWTTPALAPVSVTQPGGITLSAISSQAIRITWDDTPNETAYEIWGRAAKGNQKFSLLTSVPADTVTWDWGGLKRYTSYCAEIRGMLGGASGEFSNPVCATTNK